MSFKVEAVGFFKKHRSKLVPLAIALVGVILLIFSSGASDSGDTEDELTRQVREFCEDIEGVGECRVMISYENSGSGYFPTDKDKRVAAVAVACRGAERKDVQKTLKDMLSSFFGIGTNKVSVLRLNLNLLIADFYRS